MARFRSGQQASQEAAVRTGGGKFTPTHRFEAGETKYIQFITPPDDIPTVLMHRFIQVGEKDNGDPRWADFISLRDPNLEGPNGYDSLWDRFTDLGPGYGSKPSERTIALAVELEPVYRKEGTRRIIDGWDIVTREFERDGETVTVPNVALINESPFTFWPHVWAYNDMKDITESIYAVKRTGKSTDTTYTLMEAGEALDVEEALEEFFEEFDFEAYLEELADENRMRELVEPLADDYVVNKYALKGKGKTKKSEPASSRSRKPREEESEEAYEEAGDDGEEEATQSRSRRFSNLRTQVKKGE